MPGAVHHTAIRIRCCRCKARSGVGTGAWSDVSTEAYRRFFRATQIASNLCRAIAFLDRTKDVLSSLCRATLVGLFASLSHRQNYARGMCKLRLLCRILNSWGHETVAIYKREVGRNLDRHNVVIGPCVQQRCDLPHIPLRL